ncbi:MAG TPA: transglycosylase SLT domain-containing protein [Terriglobales bacterium]|jgi:membrane-bound lytic murein transglycosylase D|nr:transglycosylase SLT domain-containing protein [Terriglobales bacterium]
MSIGKRYLQMAGGIALMLGSLACQTGPHSTALLPAKQASAPAMSAPPAVQAQGPAETKPAASPVPPRPEVKTDPAADLIAQVEKEYQAGQANYQAGHLDAAKENFDRAFNLLLESPLDVGSDERLQQEFDRLLDGVNGLEMQALQQGDGFTEQKSEPAPIDEANEVTYPVDPNIKAKAEAEIKETHSDLPLMMTDPVAGYINYFSTRGRGTLERALARSGRYQDMIRRVLKEEGVPQDLIYLAQAESGFHPLAVSRAGARGMWQFMGSRAKGYGLERNWWVDDRQDPEKSTRAAAHHLKDLYNQFGDWYLAMAAYNSGPGTVQSAVKRTGYADFWQLYKRNVLPKETRNYVPIIIAVTIMAKNPQQYGLEDVAAEKPEPYDTVEIDYPVDLRLVAECVDASAGTLQELNPSLLRLTTPKDREFELHLPEGSKDRYLTTIRAIPPDMRVWWRYHNVAAGDTLASVAKAYHSNRKTIAEANGLGEEDKLTPESKLIIPVAPGKHPSNEGEAAYARHVTRYKVRKGDTVESVADNFGVPPAMVRRWNHLKGDSLGGRRVLYVRLPVTPSFNEKQSADSAKSKPKKMIRTADKKSPVRHTVEPGETLYSIAKSHNTTVAALKQQNGNLATLKPGMILLIQSGR